MSKRYFLLIGIIAVCATGLQAQCLENLRRARTIYNEGNLHRIEQELTSDCLGKDSDLNEEEKSEAYRLLILSYLYQDLSDKADEAMQNLLDENPWFKINPETDPNELINLYSSFRTDPIFRFGFKVWFNYSSVNIIKAYTITNARNANGKYNGNINFGGSGFIEKDFFSNKVTLRAEPTFILNKMTYVASGFPSDENPNTATTQWEGDIENQTWLGLNLTARRAIFSNNESGKTDGFAGIIKKIDPHIILGGSGQYLFTSSSSNTTKIEGGESASGADLDLIKLQHRNRINIGAIAGLGIKLPAGKMYFVADITYHYGLVNITDKNNSLPLNFLYGRAMSDMSLNTINLSIGLMFDQFSPKKLTE